jgi:hypothetical protein
VYETLWEPPTGRRTLSNRHSKTLPRRPLDSAQPSNSWRQTYKNAAPRHGRHSRYRTFSKATGALLYSVRRPTSSQSTHPASAKPTRALPTGENLQSTSFTSAPARWQPSAEKLGQLPTCSPPNPACCHLSTQAFGFAQPALFRACCSSSVATFAVRKLLVRLYIQRARTVVYCYVVVLQHPTTAT